MGNVLTYDGPDDLPSLWEIFWPSNLMQFHPQDLKSSLEYYYRIRRGTENVDSEVGPVRKLAFCTDKIGRYTLAIGKEYDRLQIGDKHDNSTEI